MDSSIWEDLDIPRLHVKPAGRDRYTVVVHKSWLKCLEQKKKLQEFPPHLGLDRRINRDLGHSWTKVFFQIFKKYNHKVLPLPRSKGEINNDIPLTYSQILNYVSLNNYKNLWTKNYKKFNGSRFKIGKQSSGAGCKKIETGINLVPYDTVLRELIQRMFGCCIIHSKLDRIRSPVDLKLNSFHQDIHSNLLAAIAAIETGSHIVLVFYPPCIETTVYDCITYSPAILSKSHNKPLFISYQILQLARHLHDYGLMLGDLRLEDILIHDNQWIQVIPRLESNIIQLESDDTPTDDFSDNTKFDLKFAYDLQQFSLREYTEMWCNGQLSNFDYLTILNNISGRRIGCAEYHHIMPWVTDFTQRNGMNWRDLTKSKYRINKGDAHLDVMFNSSSENSVPHHVSDFLSEITYFVYMARRTPQHILCQHVRPIWVPAEYPISIQRLQEWTPDECIPEFYSDPMIFKSIHEDLPDLELPLWSSCPEDFIAKHREALESQHVSERLNHWIDLNFGYKLQGQPAIKSKNVCLTLVDNHKNLTQRGIVQLFTYPHPPKRFASAWHGSVPPRISTNEQKRRMTRSSEDLSSTLLQTEHSSDFISPSRKYNSSPKAPFQSSSPNIPEDATTSCSSNMERSTSYHASVQKSNTIVLPKDYNPCSQLNSLENMEVFLAKTFLNQKSDSNPNEKVARNDLMFDESSDNSFTNFMFAETFDFGLLKEDKRLHNVKHKNLIVQNTTRNFKQIISERRSRELQVVGCLLVEIFLINKLRPLLSTNDNQSFESRLIACRTVARNFLYELPKCIQQAVKLFLQLYDTTDYAVITDVGLPNPSAHQTLQPILSNTILPFPTSYFGVYALMRCLHNFEEAAKLLSINTFFQCDGSECSRFDDLDRKRVVYGRKIAECKVKAFCLHIERLLEPTGYEQFNSVELLLPHVINLLNTEETSILTAWYLFDSIARALGIKDTQKHLLEPILRLYDAENDERQQFLNSSFETSVKFTTSSSFKSRKSVKLYHHSFLLRLMVRFGLKCFLDNFVPPLVEAVGGYKEPEESTGFHYHSNRFAEFKKSRSARNLKFCCNDESENSVTLISPEHSEIKSDRTISPDNSAKQEVEDLFTFESECEDNITININNIEYEEKSVDSLELRMNHSNAEEAIEDATIFSPEKIAIDDIIYGDQKLNVAFDEDRISLNSQVDSPKKSDLLGPKSPTILIPSAFRRSYELSTIDCEIGSRKSIDSIDLIPQSSETLTKDRSYSRETDDSMQASIISQISENRNIRNNRLSEMSTESLIWLSHRLGPVLTARYLTRNLLKMLTLCYVGQENLLPDTYDDVDDVNLNYFTIADSRVVGDHNAARVLECLTSIAALFGEQFILLQYLPHVSELIALCKKKITSSLEGALISALQLLKYLVPCLTDSTIMEQLQFAFLSSIIHPIVRLLRSSRCVMPNGFLARSVLTRKLLDAIYVLSVRIGPEMSKEYLCVPALQRFFLIFNKAYGITDSINHPMIPDDKNQQRSDANSVNSSDESNNYVEIRRDGKVKEWNIKGSYISQVNPKGIDGSSDDSNSSPLKNDPFLESSDIFLRDRALDEIRDVFTPNLAHCSYLAFLKFLGEAIMAKTVINLGLILNLCHEFEQPDYSPDSRIKRLNDMQSIRKVSKGEDDLFGSNSFGTSVIGNRIEVVNTPQKHEMGPMEVLDLVAFKCEQVNTTRHLRGNWLAYWEHEIGRSDKDSHLNLKQIKLQTFAGHTNSVRSILCLDNENSFMSASKDKTVKLWSLRSEGDGKKISACQYVYSNHKKSVHSLAFLESMRLAVSCDSGVHLWDPFVGSVIAQLDSTSRFSPVSVVRTYPSPSRLILAGTADSTVKIIDSRLGSYVNEWKVTSTANCTVRCLACAPSGNWLAVGLSSGNIILLDGRTGMVLGSWKATDGELLQLVAPNDNQIISSSLDHSIAVWSVADVSLQFMLKQPQEPAHCLQLNGKEIIFATPANRIGVYSNISTPDGTYSMTKLRSETLKGVLTSLAVLPLNRMLLAGNDSGNIVLLC